MGQRIEIFCEISVKKKYLQEPTEGFKKESFPGKFISDCFVSEKYFVSINLGDGKGWNWLKNQANEEYTCDSQVEAMNYMSRQGWRMIKNFRDVENTGYYKYNILFRKEVSS